MGDKDSLISPLWCFIISECPQNRGRLLYEWMDGWTDSFKGSKNCRIGIRVGWSWGWKWGPWAMPAGCLLGDWQVCGHPFTSSFNSRTFCSLFFLLPFLSSLHLPFVPSLQYFTFLPLSGYCLQGYVLSAFPVTLVWPNAEKFQRFSKEILSDLGYLARVC